MSQSPSNGEKWREIWQICEEVRKLPDGDRASYLRQKRLNASMERDVLSLLAEPEDSIAPSWNASTSDAAIGGGAAVKRLTLTGCRIGRYVVAEEVGAGAGGEVYAARDTDLERPVALKFLHPERLESRWQVERFLREARAASALNHPGIITVYEVIQSESGLAIATELVTGQPLRKLCGKPNSIEDVIAWGRQIADALGAAHAGGIFHRDVKPENLMLRDDGRIKILDFGLAQMENRIDESLTSNMPVGTLRYMSPEQARGEKLTPATDVFSLGLVLYELATGRHPFPIGEGAIATVRAIVTDDPPLPSALMPGFVKPLETLILQMMQKEHHERPKMAEVARRLEAMRGSKASGRSWGAKVAAIAVVAVGMVGFWVWLRERKSEPHAALAPIPLTATPGVDSWPDISPDGESVVYGWGASAESYTHLYVKRLEQDAPVLLMEAAAGERIGHPKWSPDGRRILFKSSLVNAAGGLWTISSDGSKRQEIVQLKSSDLSSGVDWSSDGRRILYTESANGEPFRVYELDVETRKSRQMTSPAAGVWGDRDPEYSPDGKTFAFKRVRGFLEDQLMVAPVGGGEPRQVTRGTGGIWGFTWAPDGRLVLSCQLGGVVFGLWRVTPSGAIGPEPLHQTGLDATMPAVRKNKLAWVNRLEDHNVYALPLAGGKPAKIIGSAMYDSKVALAPDGRIAYVSRRSASPEIWLAGAKAAESVRLTNFKAEIGVPTWSPDGKRLLFSLVYNGVETIFAAECVAGELRCQPAVALHPGAAPAFTADGKYIFFANGKKAEIARIPAFGGEAKTYPNCRGLWPRVSQDNHWLYYATANNVGPNRVVRVALNGAGEPTGPEQLVLDRSGSTGWEHWTLAKNEVIYWDNDIRSKFSGLRALDVNTRRIRTIVETPDAYFPAVSPDGKSVYFSRPDRSGATVMVAEWNH